MEEVELGVIEQSGWRLVKSEDKYFVYISESDSSSIMESKHSIVFTFNPMPDDSILANFCQDLLERNEIDIKKTSCGFEVGYSPKSPPITRTSTTTVSKKPENSTVSNSKNETDFYALVNNMLSSNKDLISIETGGQEYEYIDGEMRIKKEAIKKVDIRSREVALKEMENQKELKLKELTEKSQLEREKFSQEMDLRITEVNLQLIWKLKNLDIILKWRR